jgi:hypothetical protein
MMQRRTIVYFRTEAEALKELKKYNKLGGRFEVRRHPKWKTWDVVKVIRTR